MSSYSSSSRKAESADRVEIVVIEEIIEPRTSSGRVVAIPEPNTFALQIDHVCLFRDLGGGLGGEKVFARRNEVQMSSHTRAIGLADLFLKCSSS
jgi:hypothetical protein